MQYRVYEGLRTSTFSLGRYHYATVVLDHIENNNNKGQTVVVLGGTQQGKCYANSVLLLNLVAGEPNKQWREGPPMNKKRHGHAAVVCNRSVFVMGGKRSASICMERIEVNDLLQSSSTICSTQKSHWTTLNCRLSIGRFGCCAVAVHNRYIVVMGGYNTGTMSSVEIIDTWTQTVIQGPRMTVPRSWCSSVVVGHRIFVAGGVWYPECSVEYMDFPKPCDNEETKEETLAEVIPSSCEWTTRSDFVFSDPRGSCAMVAVGSCLIVSPGGLEPILKVFDTHHNRTWNLPPFGKHHTGGSMVAVANQVAVISGHGNPACATLSVLDKNTWCFRRLFYEQQSNRLNHSLKGSSGDRDVNLCYHDKGKDAT